MARYLQPKAKVTVAERKALLDWPRLISTLLKIKNDSFPGGWLEEGKYSIHHNMDIVTLFRLGWDQLSAEEWNPVRKEISTEIGKMLAWFLGEWDLNEKWIPLNPGDESVEEQISMAANFLAEIGCLNAEAPFWRLESCPRADEMREKFIREIQKNMDLGGASGTYYQGDLQMLRSARPKT